jgi:hypothetical protein
VRTWFEMTEATNCHGLISPMLDDFIHNLLNGMGIFAVKDDKIEADHKGQRGQYAEHCHSMMLRN